MSEIEDDKVDSGTILQEMQAGYMLGERLLRPALVRLRRKNHLKTKKIRTKRSKIDL